MNKIYVTGLGPGLPGHMSREAFRSIEEADKIVGYKTYIDLIKDLPEVQGKELLASNMRDEVKRCNEVIALAENGETITLVSSGDAGVYGMAGILYELLENRGLESYEIEVIPGISAVNAAAATLGAPLMNDFCVISLSDLLTDWKDIEKRLHAAGQGDFVVALYNPKSHTRTENIIRARNILLNYKSPDTPVGIVRNAKRHGETVYLTTLGEMLDFSIDMLSIVIIGNKETIFTKDGRHIITPRGYHI